LDGIDTTGALEPRQGEILLPNSYTDIHGSSVETKDESVIVIDSDGLFTPSQLTVDTGTTVFWELDLQTYETVSIMFDNMFDSGPINLLEASHRGLDTARVR
jgi:hypothetical protein